MPRLRASDTITALATPIGEGGISVVRVSGPEAFLIASRAFRGKSDIVEAQSHTAHFGRVVDTDGGFIDQAVAVVFRGPNSYTGEDTVELSCHGGVLVTKKLVEALIGCGARHAEPGEFTKRAFLNGKLDLTQAEAVADLIHARSDAAHSSSLAQLQGNLSKQLQNLRNQLIESISLLELELDFVEEGLEFIDKSKVINQIEGTIESIKQLLESYKAGRIYREGAKVVIAGAPNAGKSSLLNALLNENRAIVTDIPGTTRDAIEESLSLGGVLFKVVDTAGVRKGKDTIEEEGIRRTEIQAQSCDILLLVIDVSQDLSEREKQELSRLVREKTPSMTPKVVALNKIDLVSRQNGQIARRSEFVSDFAGIKISALTGEGLEELKSALVEKVIQNSASTEGRITVTSARHFDAFSGAKESLGLALVSLKQGQSGEFVTVDLRRALDCLGEITGEVTTDEILDNIFSKFCIGK
ncbi:MAG: tRNA uridine-5-carboxymethylaminomethyl(34) synthesis GTPase MnmE [Ignavibacteriales bacterium]|nr:tRNA uridine-5-carboxymethylaminomethyl(34) synthesis GTPase MnmE [Ignavibacteriales bacterium]